MLQQPFAADPDISIAAISQVVMGLLPSRVDALTSSSSLSAG